MTGDRWVCHMVWAGVRCPNPTNPGEWMCSRCLDTLLGPARGSTASTPPRLPHQEDGARWRGDSMPTQQNAQNKGKY